MQIVVPRAVYHSTDGSVENGEGEPQALASLMHQPGFPEDRRLHFLPSSTPTAQRRLPQTTVHGEVTR